MKKLFIIFFLIAAFIITGLAFHKKIISALTFISMRQHRALSDEQIEKRLEEVGGRIDVLDRNLGRLPQRSSDHSLDDRANVRDIASSAKELIADREMLLAEQDWRKKRVHHFFLAGFILSLLTFLELTRRVINYRVPKGRRNRGLWGQAGSGVVAPAPRTAAVEPVDALTPGKSNQQETINLLGEPEKRASATGVDTWTFIIPLGKAQDLVPEKILEFELLNMRDADQNQGAAPSHGQSSFVTLIVTFRADLVHDVRVDTITDSMETGRTL